jgi:hypothetical protein
VLLALLAGGVVGIGRAFVKSFLENAGKKAEEQQKITKIRKHLIPSRWQEEQPIS